MQAPGSAPVVVTLYQDEHIVVKRDDRDNLVWIRRTAVPSTPEWLDGFERRAALMVPRHERKKLGLLLDTREAPIVNDPAMEARHRVLSEGLMIGYKKCAIVVRTAVGRLQVGRFNRDRKGRGETILAQIFDDEAAALAFLRT